MLLNYLYTYYYEHREFCEKANIDAAKLAKLEAANLVPKPSYIVKNKLAVKSFVAEHVEQQEYCFYLKGQVAWLAQIADLKITTENAARHYFETQYNAAIDRFILSNLGEKIVKIYPQSEWKLSDYAETWRHFTDGTYGLCTRTGLPNEIFLKHIYIRFIEFVTAANRPSEIDAELKSLLLAVVDDLDVNVESDFALHEVAQSSRQRCIIDIRKNYLP